MINNKEELIKFINSHLPQNIEYFRVIDAKRHFEYYTLDLSDKKVSVSVRLPTGKGYSSHYYSCTYEFEYDRYYYKCNRRLYDADMEAQIVRKFVNAIENYCKINRIQYPQKVSVFVDQELD